MSRFPMLLSTCVLALLATAAPAAADSLSVTAEATNNYVQMLTITTQSSTAYGDGSGGYVDIVAANKGTPCPASIGDRSDVDNQSMSEVNKTVPLGSWTGKVKAKFDYYPKGGTHLCSWLQNGSGPVAVADTPIRSYAETVGWNFLVTLFLKAGGKEATYTVTCSAGTTGNTDEECPVAGHIAMTVSKATRKKRHLKSRRIFDADFDGVVNPGGGYLRAPRNRAPLNVKFPDPVGTPVTLKVTMTSPRTRKFSFKGKIPHPTNNGVTVQAATYDVKSGGEDG